MNEALRIKELKNKPIQKLSIEDLSIKEVFDDACGKAYSQGEIQHLLKYSPIEFLEPHMEFMIEEEVVSIEHIPAIFLENYNIAVLYVIQDSVNMVMLPTHYQDNEEFIHEVACIHGDVLRFATDRVKNIEKISQIALNSTHRAFKYMPEKFKTKENCLLALKGNTIIHAENWKYIPINLTLDEDFIKQAGARCPKIFQYIEPSIKDKYDITEFFLEKDVGTLKYMSEDNKNNAALVSLVVNEYPHFLKLVGDKLKNDPEFILPIIKKAPYEIHECGEEIRSKKKIAQYICNIKVHSPAIIFFNDEVKATSHIAMISILRTPESMAFISPTLSADSNFISEYIAHEKFNPIALKYISEDLKSDSELMIKAYNRNIDSLGYIDNKLKHNHDFLKQVFTTNNIKSFNPYMALQKLQKLLLISGNEKVLLSFCDITELDINDKKTKEEILRQIKDSKFIETLKKQDDLYGYLKSASLMFDLQDNLDKKSTKSIKQKI